MNDIGPDSERAQRLWERKVVDREAIEDYAARTYHKNLSKAIAANTTPIPNQTELWMRTRAELEQKYDDSLTIENLHKMVRTTDDPAQLEAFLNLLPVTVMRDMTVSAEAEMARKDEKRKEVIDLLDFALKAHIKTANATLRLLRRFETVQDPDPDVVYVREMATTSRKIMVEKQRALRAIGVLNDDY